LSAEDKERSGYDDHEDHQYRHYCGVAATTTAKGVPPRGFVAVEESSLLTHEA